MNELYEKLIAILNTSGLSLEAMLFVVDRLSEKIGSTIEITKLKNQIAKEEKTE